jgi:hypothetical protein
MLHFLGKTGKHDFRKKNSMESAEYAPTQYQMRIDRDSTGLISGIRRSQILVTSGIILY